MLQVNIGLALYFVFSSTSTHKHTNSCKCFVFLEAPTDVSPNLSSSHPPKPCDNETIFQINGPSSTLHPVHITDTECRPIRKGGGLGVQLWSPGLLKAPQGLVNPARSPISSPSGGDPSRRAQPGSITPRRAVKWPLCVCRHVGGMGLCVGRQPLPANNGPHICA